MLSRTEKNKTTRKKIDREEKQTNTNLIAKDDSKELPIPENIDNFEE